MDGLLKDIRYGFRGLLNRPAFTTIAVLTLALGIGANTAIFSVVNAVLLRSLPFQSPEQLVSIKKSAKAGGFPGLAAYEYLAWRDHNKVFADLAAYSDNNFNLTGQGEPERISCAQVTASIFPLLGVQPLLGRAFLQEEDRPDRDRAVVVSEGFWHRRYGSDPAIIGSSITLNDTKYTVVGIMPASFRFPGEYEVWVPLALDTQAETSGDTFTLIDVVGRLKPGLEIERGQAELSLISNQVADQFVTQGKERLSVAVLDIVPLQQQLVAGIRFTILILWGAVGLVLLIACANVASLMLSRTVSRQREMAVRSAVGARRWQLLRQLLSESVLLGLAGGLLGVLLASWSTSAIASLIPAEFSTSIHNFKGIRIDRQMLAFTVMVSVLTGIIFGLAPALTASRPDLVKALREGAGHSMTGFGWRSLRGWLVVAELALALVLLVGAGLMTRSFARLTTVDTGFKTENVLTLRINLPRSRYRQPFQTATFYKELSERVAALPGVQSAGAISHTPLNGFGQIGFFRIEGQPDPERKRDRMIPMGTITGDYFRTLQIPLVSGRTYDERDTADAAPVAIINQAFAHRYLPNDDALGKRISAGCDENLCRTIVGVVGNVRQESLSDDVFPEIYLPYQQSPLNGMTLMVRTTVDPSSVIGSVRNQVLGIDKNQPVYDVKTLQQRVAEAVAGTRSLMLLFGSFAGLALVLATVGIYGVISHSVMQRTREIGVRMALGAQPRDVLKLVIGQGMILALLGIGLGLAAAFALTRLLSSLLFGVSTTDPVTFVSLSLLLGGVALLASYLPARRATKVDPLVALRYE